MIEISDHKLVAIFLIDWLEKQIDFSMISGVGHRVVFGMKHTDPELITDELLNELHRIIPYDSDHLPAEIELIEIFSQRYPNLLQVACFDTAFHRTMPRVAKLLPIPQQVCQDWNSTIWFPWFVICLSHRRTHTGSW